MSQQNEKGRGHALSAWPRQNNTFGLLYKNWSIFSILGLFTLYCCNQGHNLVSDNRISIYEKIPISVNLAKDPWTMSVFDSHIYLCDPQADKIIIHLDTTGKYINSFGRLGQGPGELSFDSRFCGYYTNYLLICSWKSISMFDINTDEYVKKISLDSYSMPLQYYNGYIISWGINQNYLLSGYELQSNNGMNYQDTLLLGMYSANEIISACRYNPLLKQGKTTVFDKVMYQSFRNSSIIIAYDTTGKILFHTDKPYKIPFPDIISYGEGDFSAPARNIYPETNITITCDSTYIYTVFSGTILQSLKEILVNHDELGQGEILLVYDRQNGAFISTFHLPHPVRDIVAHGNYLYALSVDPEIAIYKLNKAQIK